MTLKEQYEAALAEIAGLKATAGEREKVISKMDDDIKALTAERDAVKAEVVSVNEKLATETANVSAKQAEIVTLKDKLTTTEKKAAEMLSKMGVEPVTEAEPEQVQTAETIKKQFAAMKDGTTEKADFYRKHRAILNPFNNQ